MTFACSAATGFCSGFVVSFDRASLNVVADSVLEFFENPACSAESASVDDAGSFDISELLKGGMFESAKS